MTSWSACVTLVSSVLGDVVLCGARGSYFITGHYGNKENPGGRVVRRARQTIAAGISGEAAALLETCARLNSISEIGLLTCGAGRESARRKKKSKKITYWYAGAAVLNYTPPSQNSARLPPLRECKTHTCARGVLHNLRLASLSYIGRRSSPLISLVCPRACKFCSTTFTTLKWMLVKHQFSHFWWALHHFGAKTGSRRRFLANFSGGSAVYYQA